MRADVARGTLPITNGHVELPEQPGIDIDEAQAQAWRHPYMPEPALDLIRPDGSLTDR
ncbi:hypothetical protein [Nonomuraea sp. JJY05]|uniref:hypothetical protein n=1 Tax=Nonomuraea sp. JJY05 TaxID=3350255 RepID=UPI00373F41C4